MSRRSTVARMQQQRQPRSALCLLDAYPADDQAVPQAFASTGYACGCLNFACHEMGLIANVRRSKLHVQKGYSSARHALCSAKCTAFSVIRSEPHGSERNAGSCEIPPPAPREGYRSCVTAATFPNESYRGASADRILAHLVSLSADLYLQREHHGDCGGRGAGRKYRMLGRPRADNWSAGLAKLLGEVHHRCASCQQRTCNLHTVLPTQYRWQHVPYSRLPPCAAAVSRSRHKWSHMRRIRYAMKWKPRA